MGRFKTMWLFKQRKAKLFNGDTVREGDIVEFINSDGETCRDEIRRNVNDPKRLFFWNNSFDIRAYRNAVKVG